MDDRDGFVQLHLAKQKKQKLRFSYSETRKQSVVLVAMAELLFFSELTVEACAVTCLAGLERVGLRNKFNLVFHSGPIAL